MLLNFPEPARRNETEEPIVNNFELCIPTKMIFGRGTHKQVGEQVKQYANKVLLHYGGGSIKRSGLYDDVVASLKEAGVAFVELGGVAPNPRLGLVHEGIELCRKEGVELILAVGGGSTIDSAKAIAMGVPYDGEVWDFYESEAMPASALPVATILTIPAAGSESSPNTVITNEETKRKYGAGSPLLRPVFSILNPELCMTLPKNQAANGLSDMLAHIMERYFTDTPNVDVTDRMCEGVMRSIVANGPKLMEHYDSYDLWAEVMWAGKVAHDGSLGVGRRESWVSHDMEHELSAIYDIPHGQGLAIVFPAWIKHVCAANPTRFVQFAVRVFDVDLAFADQDTIIAEGIRRLEAFYQSLGLPTRLTEIGIDDREFETMARALDRDETIPYSDAMAIYRLAL